MTAPWWLLLEKPEGWEPDLEQFLLRFIPRFRTLRFSKIVRPEKFKTALCHNPKDYRSLWRSH